MSSADEDLIGTGEAATILGIDRKGVVRLCEDSKLDGAFQPMGNSPGNHWRIPRASVTAHREAGRPKKRQIA